MNITKFKKQDIYWYLFIILLLVIPLVPFVANNSFVQHVLILILLFASMSQSWNIIGGYAGQVSFGHSVFLELVPMVLEWQ